MATNSLAAYERQFGTMQMSAHLSNLLIEADGLVGCGTDSTVLKQMAEMLLIDYKSRPAGCVIMAVREGLRGVVFGHKITYPLLCQWMNEQDARVENHNFNDYLSKK